MARSEAVRRLDSSQMYEEPAPKRGRLVAAQRAAGPATVLISHPNRACCEALVRELMPGVITLRICESTKAMRQELLDCPPAMLVTELRLADGPTMRIIERMRQMHPNTRIVVVTAYGSVASAVRCSRLGVLDYYSEHELAARVRTTGEPLGSGPRSVSTEPVRLECAVWEYLNRVVERSGSISRGAAVLGFDRRSLRRMLSKHAPAP